MSNYCIAYEDKGMLKIIHPSSKWLKANNHNYKKLAELHGLVDYKIINRLELPKTREDRNGWKLNGRCIEVCSDRLRASLRRDIIQAIGRDTSKPKALKQALIDNIKQKTNINELKEIYNADYSS